MSLEDWIGAGGGKSKKPPAAKKKTKKEPDRRVEKIVDDEAIEIEENTALDDDEGEEARANDDSIDAGVAKKGTMSALGYATYYLRCPLAKCKHSKKVKISGEPKPHHLLCRKCGGTMKITKRVK